MTVKGDPRCAKCIEDGLAWWDGEPCHGKKKDGGLCHKRVAAPHDGPQGLIFFQRCDLHWEQEPERPVKK